jgi:RNA polymerase sigma factor (sigma-70 family)
MAESTLEERFRQLYQHCGSRLLAYALRRTASPEDAADVVAETFMIAWRRLGDVPPGEAEMLWLYATARRVVANLARSTEARARLIERAGAERRLAVDGQEDAAHDDALVAIGALSALEEPDREILMLVAWEGLNTLQVACALKCSPVAARVRLHRARTRLRAHLDELEGLEGTGNRAAPVRPFWKEEVDGEAEHAATAQP